MGQWNDAGETVVAGDGQAYVAPVGTARPTATDAALNAAFFGLGYHTEDGVGLNFTPEYTRHGAWQARKPIRIDRVGEALIVTFGLLQWNEISVPLAFGGGSVVANGDEFKFVPPDSGDALDEKTLVVDVEDGNDKMRIVVPRGAVTESLSVTFSDSAMAVLPISFEVLEFDSGSDFELQFSDAVSFAAGS